MGLEPLRRRLLVVSPRTGRLVKRIPVGAGAHGLAYFPSPDASAWATNGVYR
ncbi:MAG TPA: hypothetical protein VKB17_05770 [Thermoleophilaceae bacterium]|nr:hypothetical protein [Thermoleophilaceae bacterium]